MILGTIARTFGFWFAILVILAIAESAGLSWTAAGQIGLLLFIAAPFLAYWRTRSVSRARAEAQSAIIAEGIRRSSWR